MIPRPVAIISALFLAEVAAIFESSMIYAALPTLIREFGDPVTAGWLVTVHMLIGAAAALVAGRLGDIMGRKSIMMIMIGLAAVGALISSISSNFAVVLSGRVLQGLGSAVIPLSVGILRESLPQERVPVAIGLMTTGMGVGVAIGLVLGGAIVDNFNWHWLFVASAVLLGAAWLAVKAWVPARPGTPPSEPIDWLEGILPAPAIMIVLLGMSQSQTRGWSDMMVWLPIILGSVMLALWARRSLRAREPFIDLRLLCNRNVALANIMTVLLSLGTMHLVLLFSTYTQSPTWTMAGLGLSATAAGLAKLPSNVLSFFAGPLAGWLTQRIDFRVPILFGGLLACFGWIVALPLPDTLFQVVLVLCVISFGTSLLNAAMPMVIVDSVPEFRTSEAIGTMSVIRGMAAAIGVQLITLSLASVTLTTPDGMAELPSATSFRITMMWIGGLTLLATLSAFMLRPKQQASGMTPAYSTSAESSSSSG